MKSVVAQGAARRGRRRHRLSVRRHAGGRRATSASSRSPTRTTSSPATRSRVLTGAKNAEAARAFVELVSSPEGQQCSQQHGLLPGPAGSGRRGMPPTAHPLSDLGTVGRAGLRTGDRLALLAGGAAAGLLCPAARLPLLSLVLRIPPADLRRRLQRPPHPAGAPAEPAHQPRRHRRDRGRARPAGRLPARDARSSAASGCSRRSSICRWCCRRRWPASPCSPRSAGPAWRARRSGAAGITLPFTTLGVVVAQAFVAAPFFVGAARAGFAEVDPQVPRRRGDAARRARLRLPPRAACPLAAPVAPRRRRHELGAGAGRVRRDHHFRRQHAGRDADDAARRLPGAPERSRRRAWRCRSCCCSSPSTVLL